MSDEITPLEAKVQRLEKENGALKSNLKFYHRIEGLLYGTLGGALLGERVQSAVDASYPEMMDFRILTMFAGMYFGSRYLGNFFHWYHVSLPSKHTAAPSTSGENR